MASTPKSTVRARKKGVVNSTQRFLPIAEIRNDTVALKNGGYRAVIEVEALNFNLKSEVEQKGIVSGYESFINTINFPLQIAVRSTKLNVDPYITHLRSLADTQRSPLLKQQTLSYSSFVERIVDVADIMQKRFFVVVTLDDVPEKKPSTVSKFFKWMTIDDTLSKAISRRRSFNSKSTKLRERVNLIEAGLNNIGLVTKRLSTHELIELYYNIYNPETSQEQRLQGDMNTEETVL